MAEGSFNWRKLLSWSCRLLLSGVFIWAGTTKAADPAEFARQIRNYQLLPWTAAVLLALWLPWIEMLAGALLLCPRLAAGSLLVITFLLGVFLIALASAWLRGLKIDCGCFGGGAEEVLPALLRDGALLGLTVLLWLEHRN